MLQELSIDTLHFYPRPPGGGRLRRLCVIKRRFYFYPRPPGGGRHHLRRHGGCGNGDFYPRPPGGGRLYQKQIKQTAMGFLSTPSGWRATLLHLDRINGRAVFLSTPSGWRATARLAEMLPLLSNFYPRPPGGGRLCLLQPNQVQNYFYPRPPGGGRRGQLWAGNGRA